MTTKTESDKIPGFSMMSVIRNGTGAAWPVCIGYLPLGMALGVLAQKSGLTPLQIGLMSVMVFAGSAQFIAISMIQGGTSPAAIIFTVFMVNFRHFLMSSALAVPLKGVNRLFLSFFAYGITDESFAVNITRFRKGAWDKWRALTVHHTANIT
jgi:4-azaleucine resistance transporter AzlC